MQTRKEMLAFALTMSALLEAVPEEGMPSGPLYAAFSAGGMSLSGYQSLVQVLKENAAIQEANHVLIRGSAYGQVLKQFQATVSILRLKEEE